MAQHAILRFEKHKGNPARPLEAHHERQKEQYASNPDIDTSRSKYNFHIVKPEGRYYHFIQNRIEQAGCRTRKDSTRFVDTLVTASPEFFKGKSPKEIQAFFQRAEMCIRDRNTSGQQVTRTFDQSIDCFWLFDQPASHTEVYSSHFSVPEGARIKETLEHRYSFCSSEEMQLLRRK